MPIKLNVQLDPMPADPMFGSVLKGLRSLQENCCFSGGRCIRCGAMPIELSVHLRPMPTDPMYGTVLNGLRSLLDNCSCCDIVLMAAGQSFQAHRVVLAAVSPTLHEQLTHPKKDVDFNYVANSENLNIENISHPESVQAMLDSMYSPSGGKYQPSSEAVNREVLHLAKQFQLSELELQASSWLLDGVTTANVFERLSMCEELGLSEVRDQILELLLSNPDTLFSLAKDPEMAKKPLVLQDLLVRVLTRLGCDKSDQQVKNAF